MEMLDATVIATALPVMSRSLGENPIRLNLAITSYLLSLAVFIPISGWMADRFGSRTVFRAAIAIFTVGSVLCGLSGSLPKLIAARILQGFGGAMMTPVGRVVVLKTVPKSDLVEAMSYLTVPAVLGPVVGPPLGGFIVTYWSWRWIFFINVPIGLLGMTLVTLFIENLREPEVPPLDLRGFLLTGFGLAGLVFGFEAVGRGVIAAGVIAAMIGGGGLCMALYVLHARRTPYPIIDLGLLKIPTFAAATAVGGLFRIGIGALPFLLPMLLQLVFGLSPFASGMLTFTSAVGALTMKFTAVPDYPPAAIPPRTDWQRGNLRVYHGELRALPALNAIRRHRSDAVDGRVFPLAAVHRAQRARVRGYSGEFDERCEQPRQHGAAVVPEPWRDSRRVPAAPQSWAPWRRGALDARFHIGVRDHGSHGLALGAPVPAAEAGCGRGSEPARVTRCGITHGRARLAGGLKHPL